MSGPPPWEAFLAARFPGYLLPEACRRALPEEAAARFLERLLDLPDQLPLLRAASVVAREREAIEELALRQLPDLARRRPPRAATARRAWEGRLPGRLDVEATLRGHLEGRRSRFVTREPAREVDRPEDVLLKATARRLRGVLRELGAAGLLPAGAGGSPQRSAAAWGSELARCEATLDHPWITAALAPIADAPITLAHEEAALAARHPAHALAARLHVALREGLDDPDPAAIARVLAEGALAPLRASTRFELAVLLRLVEAVEARLEARAPGRWAFRRTAVLQGRRDVADFEGEGGVHVRFFYNQACLPPGPHDTGVRRYFGHPGRLRPDISIIVERPGRPARAVVVEVKLSSDPDYLVQGYREALLYRMEYAAHLTGWPGAILVTSVPVAAAARREDDVIAVGWDSWVPEAVLDGLLEGIEAVRA